MPIAGVTGERLATEIHGCRALYATSVAEAVGRVVARAEEGDLVITQGAGSVSGIAPVLLEALAAR